MLLLIILKVNYHIVDRNNLNSLIQVMYNELLFHLALNVLGDRVRRMQMFIYH